MRVWSVSLSFIHWISVVAIEVQINVIRYLGNCHTLNLGCCLEILDHGVKHLKCAVFSLRCCGAITNNCVKCLPNCYDVDLGCCGKITDEEIKYLKKCKVTQFE